MPPLSPQDRALIAAAAEVVRRLYRRDRSEVGAALRTASGRVFTAVNLDTSAGSGNICAEAAAIAKAVSEGETALETVVAVKYLPEEGRVWVVPPCGLCRELISDFGGQVQVIYSQGGRTRKAPVARLLPAKYAYNKVPGARRPSAPS